MIDNRQKETTEAVIALSENLEPKISICVISDENFDDFFFKLNALNESAGFSQHIHFTENKKEAEIIFIHSVNAEEQVYTLRSQNEQFLKPIMVASHSISQTLNEFIDAYLPWPASMPEYKKCIEMLFRINAELMLLPNPVVASNDIALKKIMLLRFLHSREKILLQPKRSHHAKIGYTYPLVAHFFGLKDGQEVRHLADLEENQLLYPKLTDKVNLCPNCGHTHINYREVCPTCNSLDIFEESTIHHFQCAYVGKESEYLRGTKMICPKCSRELRHIGVDYDKPSEMLWCGSCKHNFSEPELSCFCLACAHNFRPEDAFLKIVAEYSLTNEGSRAAEEGVLPGYGLISILKKELGFYKTEVFKEFLSIEISRCVRYKYQSTMASFSLKSADEAFQKNKILMSQKFRKDFAEIINQTFRTTDIFTEKATGEVLIIFTHTPYENVKIAFQRLGELIHKQFKISLRLNFKLFKLDAEDATVDKILGASNVS